MGRAFSSGSSQHAEAASAPATAAPLTMACWFRTTTTSAGARTLMSLSASASSHTFQLYQHTTGLGLWMEGTGANQDTADFSNAVAANTWAHAAAVVASSTSRDVYLNATSIASSSTSVVPASINTTSVGRRGTASPGDYMDGSIAEVGIWNVALTVAELAALAGGARVASIRRSALVFYAPLFGVDSPEADLSGGNRDLTLTNGPTQTIDPPVQPFLVFPEDWAVGISAVAPAPRHLMMMGIGR